MIMFLLAVAHVVSSFSEGVHVHPQHHELTIYIVTIIWVRLAAYLMLFHLNFYTGHLDSRPIALKVLQKPSFLSVIMMISPPTIY
jgi:hypothetical protein